MRLITRGFALPLLGAAAIVNAATPTSPLVGQAKRAIAAEMTDPSSLQWRGLRTVHATVQGKPLTVICGEYNARNRMGGYIGFSKFAYEPTQLKGAVSMNPDGDLEMFGDSSADRSDAATETKARILGVCLGVRE